MAGVEILEQLESLGVRVLVIGQDRLRFQPASKIPPDLVSRIRDEKPAILQALRTRPSISPKSDKQVECRYDWLPGYRGLRLHCVADHHRAEGAATVFRMTGSGRDVLLEMLELGILVGQASEDAQRVN